MARKEMDVRRRRQDAVQVIVGDIGSASRLPVDPLRPELCKCVYHGNEVPSQSLNVNQRAHIGGTPDLVTVHVVYHSVRVIDDCPRLVVLPHRRHVVQPDVGLRPTVRYLKRSAVPMRRSVRVVLVRFSLQWWVIGVQTRDVSVIALSLTHAVTEHTFFINGKRSAQLHPGFSCTFAQSS